MHLPLEMKRHSDNGVLIKMQRTAASLLPTETLEFLVEIHSLADCRVFLQELLLFHVVLKKHYGTGWSVCSTVLRMMHLTPSNESMQCDFEIVKTLQYVDFLFPPLLPIINCKSAEYFSMATKPPARSSAPICPDRLTQEKAWAHFSSSRVMRSLTWP